MSTDEDRPDELDPEASNFVMLLGKKRSGKSVRARAFAEQWPRRLLVIDVLHEIEMDGALILNTVPKAWPTTEDDKGQRWPVQRVVIRIDMGAADHIEQIDAAFGLAYSTGDVLVWVDEVHVSMPTEKSRRMHHARRILVHGRHRLISLLLCGPRPTHVDRLCLMQSDHVLVFDLPQRDDRERIADDLGVDRDDLAEIINTLPPHGYAWINTLNKTLTVYPAYPIHQHKTRRPEPPK